MFLLFYIYIYIDRLRYRHDVDIGRYILKKMRNTLLKKYRIRKNKVHNESE